MMRMKNYCGSGKNNSYTFSMSIYFYSDERYEDYVNGIVNITDKQAIILLRCYRTLN